MGAPTLWEEGRWSARRIIRLSLLLTTVLTTLSIVVVGRVGPIFDIGFVLLCVAAALAVRPGDFYGIVILPPLLLLALSIVVAGFAPAALGAPGDTYIQAVVSGLAHHATALGIGYGLTLAILAIRLRVIGAHANRLGSPAPYRAITGVAPERSTTVVGSDPQSPESMTASS